MAAQQMVAWLIGIGLVGFCASGHTEEAGPQKPKPIRVWADAAVVLDDDHRTWLDEMPLVARSTGLSPGIPFSFVYGGKPSTELLPAWRQIHSKRPLEAGREHHVATYIDSATGLEVTSEVTLFAKYPAPREFNGLAV